MRAIKFKNYTNEDFTYSFDSVPYTFKAGQEIFMEDFKAEHFAKHLVDRELNKVLIPTNFEAKRKELWVQCFPSDEEVTPTEALDIEEKKKVKPKKVEEEFADLKVGKKKK